MMYHPERIPRDPYYEYHRPYSTSSSSSSSPTCRPCPICQAPPTSFHADTSSGDVICTNCGAVLDEKLRDDAAEWRDYSNNSNNDTDVGVGRKRARCGDSIVDETKYIGGLVPTKISSTCFTGGGGGGAGGREDKFKLATIRQRLKRTHNVIENRIVQEQKARYAEIVLDRQAREAKLRRGETVSVGEDADGAGGGIVVEGGDYEGLMRQRQEQSSLLSRSSASTIPSSTTTTREPASTVATDHHEELAYASVEHPKWSLPDTLLLFGTLEQVRHHLPSSHHEDGEGGGWTQVTLDDERYECNKRIDANTRTSLHRLYIAYDLLERAARALDLYGGGGGSVSNATFRLAVATLIKFVITNDGLRVRGISSGGLSSFSTLSLGDGTPATTTLSLFGGGGMAWSTLFDAEPATSLSSLRSSTKSTSPSTILHRLRQYASLGSAILYLAAKSTGIGRTLTEVCSAFGTFAVINSNNGKGGGGGVAEEPLVRPKYCSRAMQELRSALPDVVASLPQDGIPVKNERVTLPPSSSQLPLDMATTDGHTPIKLECIPEIPSSSIIDHGDIASNPISVVSTEEAALVDLTTRIATSLGLPPIAIHAAATVTLQCARDVQIRMSSSKRCIDKKHIRPSQRIRKLGGGNCASFSFQNGESPEVIAISSILLMCTAGGTMQRLARQAVSTSASSSTSSSTSRNPTKILEVGEMSEDLNDDFLTFPNESRSWDAISPVKIAGEVSTTNFHKPINALSPWEAWDDQPPWHRDISQMEQCTGIPRKVIVSFYSKVIHPRRLFLLGLMNKMEQGCETLTTTRSKTAEATSAGLLHNIVAAAPLMSLRNL